MSLLLRKVRETNSIIISSYRRSELAELLRSPCVPCAFPLDSLAKSAFPSLICITVESMTSPIVITQGKNVFLHTNEVSGQCLASQVKMRSSILISVTLRGH